jgi:6-phosphogluconolactonase (cycloisomerase 2 family)
MRRFVLCAALALASARPLAAQTLLYSTAGSAQRVDAFAVYADGTPSAEPVKQHATGGKRPRRIISRGCNLYVAEDDRAEVFRIHSGGGLELIGATRTNKESHPHDIALSADGRTLYVPMRRMGAIGSYPLDADGVPSLDVVTQNGVPAGGPSSCAWGPAGAGWEDIVVANGNLYAAYFGHLNVYGIDEAGRLTGSQPIPKEDKDGNIVPDETVCATYSLVPSGVVEQCIDPNIKPRPPRPDVTCPFSTRGHISGAVGLVVQGTTLITSVSQTHILLGFLLDATGNFPAYGTDPARPTKKERKQERKMRVNNKTTETIRYIGVTLFQPPDGGNMVVYGAGYSGRTDAFRLRDDGTLPPAPEDGSQDDFSTTPRNRVSTPVRTTAGLTAQGKPMLYVAGGELDRIQAFHLFSGGLINPQDSPAQTNSLDGSFPNDVVLVDISSCD